MRGFGHPALPFRDPVPVAGTRRTAHHVRLMMSHEDDIFQANGFCVSDRCSCESILWKAFEMGRELTMLLCFCFLG